MSTKPVTPSGEESYVAKLTIKTLGCNPSMVKTLPAGTEKMSICRFYGKVQDVRYQENKDNGSIYTYFAGNFEGINMQDGTVLRSGKLFLPKGISEVVETAIKKLKANEATKNESITFAFEIRAVKATNPIGYSYEAAALKDPAAEDELAELRKALATLPTYEQKALGKGASAKTLDGKK